jgi:asparagine synthetase B (glutamine-hydrolysing)
MDTTLPQIEFDEQGVCGCCKGYQARIREDLHYGPEDQELFRALLERIRKEGERHEYDCMLGVSGGVDSTYVAYLVKEKFGLR